MKGLIVSLLLPFLALFAIYSAVTAQSNPNLAPLAVASASTTYPAGLPTCCDPDLVNDDDTDTEWASNGEGNGAWARLEWATAQTVGYIQVFDRFNGTDNATQGLLELSDGTSEVFTITVNQGTHLPSPVEFSPRSITWAKVTILQFQGSNSGFSEFQAYLYNPDTPPTPTPTSTPVPPAPDTIGGVGYGYVCTPTATITDTSPSPIGGSVVTNGSFENLIGGVTVEDWYVASGHSVPPTVNDAVLAVDGDISIVPQPCPELPCGTSMLCTDVYIPPTSNMAVRVGMSILTDPAEDANYQLLVNGLSIISGNTIGLPDSVYVEIIGTHQTGGGGFPVCVELSTTNSPLPHVDTVWAIPYDLTTEEIICTGYQVDPNPPPTPTPQASSTPIFIPTLPPISTLESPPTVVLPTMGAIMPTIEAPVQIVPVSTRCVVFDPELPSYISATIPSFQTCINGSTVEFSEGTIISEYIDMASMMDIVFSAVFVMLIIGFIRKR